MGWWSSPAHATDDAAPRRSRRRAGPAGGLVVLAALVAWNVGNYVFFLAAGRMLGPHDFGLAAALLAVTVMASVPGNALQYGVARSVAAAGRSSGAVASAVYRRAWRTSLRLLPFAALAIAAAVAVARLVEDETPVGPLLLTGAVVLPMAALFLSLGQLQGDERYRPYAATFASWGVPRPVLLLPLAAAGLGVYAALGATALAVLGAAALGALLTGGRLRERGEPAPEQWRAFTAALPPVVVGLAAVACLTNLDVVAAKLALSSADAGYYGAEAVLGKAVIVVPQALSTILLPRVAARRAGGGDTGRVLALATLITLAVGALVALACLPSASLITRIAFGSDYAPGASLLAPLVVASTLLGVAILLVAHHTARGDHRFVWAMGPVVALHVALLAVLGGSGGGIVWANIAAGAAVICVHEAIHGRGSDGLAAGLVRLARAPRGSAGDAGPHP